MLKKICDVYTMASVFDSPLEISQLLSHPFLAAVGADSHMAYSTVEFIRDVGFRDGEGAELGEALMLEFTYNVSNIEDSNPANIIQTTSANTFKIPLLAVVAVPSLRIQRVEVDLVLEVNQIVTENSSATGPRRYRAMGRLTSDRKIETESFSNYKVKMVAESIGDSPGMSALLKVLTNTAQENITPAYVHIANTPAEQSTNGDATIVLIHPLNIKTTDTIKIALTDGDFTPIDINVEVVDGNNAAVIRTVVGNSIIITGVSSIGGPGRVTVTFNTTPLNFVEISVIDEGFNIVQKAKKVNCVQID